MPTIERLAWTAAAPFLAFIEVGVSQAVLKGFRPPIPFGANASDLLVIGSSGCLAVGGSSVGIAQQADPADVRLVASLLAGRG